MMNMYIDIEKVRKLLDLRTDMVFEDDEIIQKLIDDANE